MSVVVYAPASIGNVGVGFDVLGAAIKPIDGSLLGDRVKVTSGQSPFSLTCIGRFVEKLPKDPEENIVYQCYQVFAQALNELGQPVKSIEMTLEKNMPIGSGLGSSACSIVAALDALNQFHDNPLSQDQLLRLMGEMEASISGSLHYDNVAPCYLGGLQLLLEQEMVLSQPLPCFEHWYWVMAYPGIKTATAEARAILPKLYPRQDVIEHGRHLAGFVHACYSQQENLAVQMLKDVVAEPYREQLLPHFDLMRQQMKALGALATGISGSGPTVFNIARDLSTANQLAQWLQDHYLQNAQGFVHVCRLDTQGSRLVGKDF